MWKWVFAAAGGTFALYALLCRHLKLSIILNQQAADEDLSLYKMEPLVSETARGLWFRQLLENHKFLKQGLLLIVLLGTCMVIGDGALTPALSGRNPNPNLSSLHSLCMSYSLLTLVCVF